MGSPWLSPVTVAFSRMYRGMHFLTDVLGGVVLGCAWLAVVTAVMLPQRSRGSHRPVIVKDLPSRPTRFVR